MIDGIIKADGTSRLMRATLPATYEEFKTQAAAGALPLDVLFNASGWSQMPTFLNKATLLKDATSNLFGLDANAVPDSVFDWLGKYNTHWWSVLHGQAGKGYNEVKTAFNTMGSGSTVPISKEYSFSQTLYYSKSVTIDQNTGVVSLSNPQSMTVVGDRQPSVASEHLRAIIALAPVYITNLYGSPNTIYYVPSGVTYTESFYNVSTETFGCTRYDGGYGLVLNGTSYCSKPVYTVSSQVYNIPAGETTYEHSTDRNAYPDSGTVSGLTYQYLGIPFDNAVTAPAIATGSYTGTGTNGSANKNSITLDFVPKLVFFMGPSSEPSGMWVLGQDRYVVHTGSSGVSNSFGIAELSGNTLYWYYTGSAANQLNFSSKTYSWVAIG